MREQSRFPFKSTTSTTKNFNGLKKKLDMSPGCRECNYYLPNRAQCLHEFDVRKGLAGMCGQFRDRSPMEVKPSRAGTFVVSLFQHTPERLFIHNVTLSTDGSTWDYKEYAGQCYVCFIHSKIEEPKQ